MAVADGGKLELQLQGLPLPARFLTSEVPYRGDNVHVIVLASIPLNADLFDGQLHAGPVPLLFSSHKEETLASLLANPQLAHAGRTLSAILSADTASVFCLTCFGSNRAKSRTLHPSFQPLEKDIRTRGD